MLVVPSARFLAIMVLVILALIIVPMLVVSLAFTLSLSIGNHVAGGNHQHSQRPRAHRFCCSHLSLQNRNTLPTQVRGFLKIEQGNHPHFWQLPPTFLIEPLAGCSYLL